MFFLKKSTQDLRLTIFSFLVWFKFRLSQLCSSFKIARAPSSVHPSLCVELHFSRRLFIGFAWITDYGRMMSRLQILFGQNHNPNPNRYSFKMSSEAQWIYGAEIATKNIPNTIHSANLTNWSKHLQYVGKRPYRASIGRGLDHIFNIGPWPYLRLRRPR